MGLFNTLMSKIFGTTGNISTPRITVTPAANQPATAAAATTPTPPAPPVQPAPPPEPVDVDAVLTALAAKNPEKLDWKKSIVDLMKLVDMDSSLSARKELADDLGYQGDKSDSAKMNVWLHKQVLTKLAENGGKIPAELLS